MDASQPWRRNLLDDKCDFCERHETVKSRIVRMGRWFDLEWSIEEKDGCWWVTHDMTEPGVYTLRSELQARFCPRCGRDLHAGKDE